MSGADAEPPLRKLGANAELASCPADRKESGHSQYTFSVLPGIPARIALGQTVNLNGAVAFQISGGCTWHKTG